MPYVYVYQQKRKEKYFQKYFLSYNNLYFQVKHNNSVFIYKYISSVSL